MCESLRYASAAGLDADAVVRAVGAGAAGSWAMNNLGHKVVANDFAPGFMIEHMAKDLGIAVSEAERLGLEPCSRARETFVLVDVVGVSKYTLLSDYMRHVRSAGLLDVCTLYVAHVRAYALARSGARRLRPCAFEVRRPVAAKRARRGRSERGAPQ